MRRATRLLANIGEACLKQEIDKAAKTLCGSVKVLTTFQNAENTPSRLADCEIQLGIVLRDTRNYLFCREKMTQARLSVSSYDSMIAVSSEKLIAMPLYKEGIKDIIKLY